MKYSNSLKIKKKSSKNYQTNLKLLNLN